MVMLKKGVGEPLGDNAFPSAVFAFYKYERVGRDTSAYVPVQFIPFKVG
jgi:hypothetical protein